MERPMTKRKIISARFPDGSPLEMGAPYGVKSHVQLDAAWAQNAHLELEVVLGDGLHVRWVERNPSGGHLKREKVFSAYQYELEPVPA